MFSLFKAPVGVFKTKTGGAFDVDGLRPPHRGSAGFLPIALSRQGLLYRKFGSVWGGVGPALRCDV